MGLDGRLCRWGGVAADCMGKCAGVYLALLVLSGEVSRVLSVKTLPVFVSGTCDLGGSVGFAESTDQAWFCDVFSGSYHAVDDSDVARKRRVDLQLCADLADLVHGNHGTTIR